MSGKGPVDVVENPGSILQWDDTDRRLLAYPCAENKIYNMLAFLPSSAVGVVDENSECHICYKNHIYLATDSDFLEIGWSSIASKGNLVQAFSKFSPEVQQLVEKADDSLRVFALSDFEPLPTWVRGRMALLGDAAHVLQPCESNALASPFPAPCDALM